MDQIIELAEKLLDVFADSEVSDIAKIAALLIVVAELSDEA